MLLGSADPAGPHFVILAGDAGRHRGRHRGGQGGGHRRDGRRGGEPRRRGRHGEGQGEVTEGPRCQGSGWRPGETMERMDQNEK